MVSAEEYERRILVAEMNWLRRIAGKTRRARIRNEVIRRKLGQTETLASRISKRRLTWFEHVVRKDDKSFQPTLYIVTWMEKRVEDDKQRHVLTT